MLQHPKIKVQNTQEPYLPFQPSRKLSLPHSSREHFRPQSPSAQRKVDRPQGDFVSPQERSFKIKLQLILIIISIIIWRPVLVKIMTIKLHHKSILISLHQILWTCCVFLSSINNTFFSVLVIIFQQHELFVLILRILFSFTP